MSFPALRSGVSKNALGASTPNILYLSVDDNPAGSSQYTDLDWRHAIERAMAAGIDFVVIDSPWTEIETSQGVYDLSRFVRAIQETGPLNLSAWLNIRALAGADGRAKLPAYLSTLAFDDPTMLTAITNLLT